MEFYRGYLKNFIYFFGVCILLNSFLSAQEKVLIISHHHAQPFFVEIQAKTFKKFIRDEYEFVIFNDGKTPEIAEEIDRLCKENNIRCIRIDQSLHDRPYMTRFPGEDYNHPCVRCANVVQYSLDVLGFDYGGPVVVMDSDMFPVKPISFREYLQDYDLVGVPQSRPCGSEKAVVHYIWNGLVMFNMPNLPERSSMNFNCGLVEGYSVDVGGHMHYYLLKHKGDVRLGSIAPEPFSNTVTSYKERSLDPAFEVLIPLITSAIPTNMETFLKGTLVHYRSGGKWEPREPGWYERKNEIIKAFVNDLVK